MIRRLKERYDFSPVLRLVNVVMFLTFILEILNSDLGLDTDYPGILLMFSLRPEIGPCPFLVLTNVANDAILLYHLTRNNHLN